MYESEKKTKTISLSNIIWLVFIIQTKKLYFAARTEYLNVILIKELEFDTGSAHMRLMAHKLLPRRVYLLVLLFSQSLLFYKFSVNHIYIEFFFFNKADTRKKPGTISKKQSTFIKIPKTLTERKVHSFCSIDLPKRRENVQNQKILGINSRNSVGGQLSTISCRLGGQRLILFWGMRMILQHYNLPV